MAYREKISDNRFLSDYLRTNGEMVDAIGYSYFLNSWINSKIYENDDDFLLIYSNLNEVQGLNKFISSVNRTESVNDLIKIMMENREIMNKPFNSYIIPGLTISCLLNYVSKRSNIQIALVSGDVCLNYCLSEKIKFNIILYEYENKYYPGFSKNFMYDDVSQFSNYKNGLNIVNIDENLTFNALVSAISNIPKFLNDLGPETVQDFIYFLDLKCRNNENIEKKVKKLKNILTNPNIPCLKHNYTKASQYRCGRMHCDDCVDEANLNSTYLCRCLCGKYIRKNYTSLCCIACEKKVKVEFIVKCNNNLHLFCANCLEGNSNMCYICSNLICSHNQYIKTGWSEDMGNFSFGCKECNATVKVK